HYRASHPHTVLLLPFTASPYRERRIVGPAEGNAGSHSLHWLEIGATRARVVARVDERYLSLDQLHDRDVTRRAHLERAVLRHAVDHLGGIDCRHGDDLLEREP